jgi:3-hydroxy-3-methylglutaryl CoA synthase
MVHLDVHLLAVISGVFIPIVVGIVTKARASSKVKSIANVALSIAAGAVAMAIEHHGDITADIFFTWVVSITTYYGFWRPVGAAGVVQEKTADLGVG